MCVFGLSWLRGEGGWIDQYVLEFWTFWSNFGTEIKNISSSNNKIISAPGFWMIVFPSYCYRSVCFRFLQTPEFQLANLDSEAFFLFLRSWESRISVVRRSLISVAHSSWALSLERVPLSLHSQGFNFLFFEISSIRIKKFSFFGLKMPFSSRQLD